MSRVKHTVRNAKVSLFFYLLATVTGFITRKIFLDYLGDDFMGLTGTLKSILGFLNLAELGIGTAISFMLYKPLFEKNHEEIKQLLYLIRFLYKRLGLIILGAGLILSLFFPLIFQNQPMPMYVIYLGFYAYLLAAVFGFFVNSTQIILEADQKVYVIAGYFQSFNIIRQIAQAGIAYYMQSMVLWLCMEMIFSMVNSYYINRQVNKTYPFLKVKIKSYKNIYKEYPLAIEKIKQVFVHKISSFVTSGTDQLLIYALVSLKSVAFFGNYLMIFSQINVLVNNLFAGMAAGVGNLVAENDHARIHKVFWEMMGVRVFLAGIILINLYFLVDPFITIWLGDKYILDRLIIYVMLFNLGMKIIRLPIDNYITAYGLYQDTWAPIAQITINLTISIIFGIKMGIAGIMLGTSISMFTIMFLWKPYFLYKNGFSQNVYKSFWPNFLKMILSLIISFVIIYWLVVELFVIESRSFLTLTWSIIKINLLILPIISLILYLFNQGFRDFVGRLIKMSKL
ncbi:hypothetical protein OO010_14380 [Flavobacteriaceae bacterium KMM 6898]|nr:hypothetical protein [Flavobacteriaceae bacterium KMM 6898]